MGLGFERSMHALKEEILIVERLFLLSLFINKVDKAKNKRFLKPSPWLATKAGIKAC